MKKTNTYLLLSFALLLSLTQCRCKDDKKPCNDPTNVNCENYDPCYGKKPTADFTLRQWDGWAIKPEDAIPEDCDTILLHGIRAQALSPVAQSYSWKIGTDDREFTDKELRMTFSNYKNDSNNLNPDNNHYYKPIPVTLTVRNPESQCVGANDTVLQRTRNLVFVNGANRPNPIHGKFVGISDFDKKEREIEIVRYFIDSTFLPHSVRTAFVNFPNLDNKDSIIMRAFPQTILNSFKYRWWDGGYTSYYSAITSTYPYDGLNMCKIYIVPIEGEQDYIKIEYRYVNKENQYKEYTFTGRRKN